MTNEASSQPLNLQYRNVNNKSVSKQIPAIDRFFVEDHTFITYASPPVNILTKSDMISYQATYDEYKERLTFIQDDLKWLLALNYQKFWCQVIYNESAQLMIDSYLKLSPRPHDILKLNQLPKELMELHNSIHKYVFLVCLRMSTYKESKENFLTPEAFADIIYNNYLFDIPKILDLCVLYKKNPIVKKIVENLFSTQKKYFQDFKFCIRDLIKSIEQSKKKLRNLFDTESLLNFNQKSSKEITLEEKLKTNLKDIFEIIYFLTDLVITLNSLISFQASIAQLLIEEKFERNIKDLMESTLFPFEDSLKTLNADNQLVDLVQSKVKPLKFELTKLFNKMLVNCYVTPIMETMDHSSSSHQQTSKIASYVDNFTNVCCELLEDVRFLCYYEEKFYLSEKIELLYELNKIDNSQFSYLIDSLKSVVLSNSKKSSIKARFIQNANEIVSKKSDNNKPRVDDPGVACNIVDDYDNLDALTKSILDLFPDQNAAVLKKYLKYYNNNAEQVINALLENNLPNFEEEDNAINRVSKEEENDVNVFEKFSELSLRKNIYDGDQFDVFKTDKVDLTKIHQGKKNKTDTFDLDDKTDIDREYFSRYDHIMHQREEEDMRNNYEDEYDDTYDENTTANDDFISDFVKPLNKKLDVKKREVFEGDDDEEEEEVDETAETTNKAQTASSSTAQNRNFNNQRNQYNPRQPNQYGSNKFQFTTNQPHQANNFNPRQANKYSQGQVNGQNQQAPRQNDRYYPQQRNDHRNQQQQQQYQSNQGNQSRYENQNQQTKRPSNDDNRSKNQTRESEKPLPQRKAEALPQRQNERKRVPKVDAEAAVAAAGYSEEESDNDLGPNNANQNNNAANNRNPDGTVKTEQDIKRERKWKNDNKAKIAHHNRKDLAAKKQNRGFF